MPCARVYWDGWLLSCQKPYLPVIVGRMPDRSRFGGWLATSMRSRGLSQAQLARSVGVADTQVSRWRRGQVVPSVQYLQRIADAFGVERGVLEQMVGYPVAEASASGSGAVFEPEIE